LPKYALKFHINPVKAKGRIRYALTIYEYGARLGAFKPIANLDYPLLYLLRYNQSLLEQGYVKYVKKQVKVPGGSELAEKLAVFFTPEAHAHGKIYMLYLLSLVNLRSKRRAEKLAKCFASLDPVSPVLERLLSLSEVVDAKRFIQILRGYCLCLK